MRLSSSVALTLVAAALVPACGSDEPETEPIAPIDPEYGKPLYGVDDSAASKADSFDGAAGPREAGLASSTAVWKVTRRWYEKDAGAGIAWAANSSLTWDEKYAAWIARNRGSAPSPAESGWLAFAMRRYARRISSADAPGWMPSVRYGSIGPDMRNSVAQIGRRRDRVGPAAAAEGDPGTGF